jgi:hypothetical protein
MLVKRSSILTGVEREIELDITEERLTAYCKGQLGLIQTAFPHLTDNEREFIMTGITQDEWEKM